MQPEWHKGDSLVKTVPADVNWGLLMCGRSNGLAIVIVALSWWVNTPTLLTWTSPRLSMMLTGCTRNL